MFVLMSLMCFCLRRVNVLFVGARLAPAPVKSAHKAIKQIAKIPTNPMTPLHAPPPPLTQ